jgi:hypothetical protein
VVGTAVAAIAPTVIGGIMGGGEDQSTGTQTQTVKVDVPSYLQEYVTGVTENAGEAALQPFTPYTGDRNANFTTDQLASFAGIQGMQGQYQPQYDAALGMNNQVAQMAQTGFVTPETIASYMNPYQQQVIDINKQQAIKEHEMSMNQVGDSALTAGAFGGDRHAILEAETINNTNQNLQNIQNTGMQQSYDRAVQTALQAGTAQAQTLGQAATNQANIAGAGQAYNLNDLNALNQIGTQQQALGQMDSDFAYQQFQDEQNYAMNQMQQYMSGVQPLLGGSSVGTGTVPGMSTAQGLMGGAAIGGSLLNSSLPTSINNIFGIPTQATKNAVNASIAANPDIFKQGGLVKYAKGGVVKGYNMGGPVNAAVMPQQMGRPATQHPMLAQMMGRGRPMPMQMGAPLAQYAEGGSVLPNVFGSRFNDTILGMPLNKVDTIRADALRDPNLNALEFFGKQAAWTPFNVLSDIVYGTGAATHKMMDPLVKALTTSKGEKTAQQAGEEAERQAIAEGKSRNEALKVRAAIENEFLKQARPDEFAHLNLSPQEQAEASQLNALQGQVGSIAKDLGVANPFENPADSAEKLEEEVIAEEAQDSPDFQQLLQSIQGTSEETPKNARGITGIDMPMLALGASILSAPTTGGPLGALGTGLKDYISTKAALDSAAVKGKQDQFENVLKVLNANQYAKQNELAEKRLEFEAAKMPEEIKQIQAYTSKLEAEAKSLQDPYMENAVKQISEEIKYKPGVTEADFTKMVSDRANSLRSLAGAGSPDLTQKNATTVPSDPLQLFAR